MTIEALQAQLEAERAARRAAEKKAAENLAARHYAIGRTLDLAEPLDVSEILNPDLTRERAELYRRALVEAAKAGGVAVSEKRKNTVAPGVFAESAAADPNAWAVACEPESAEALRAQAPGAQLLTLVEAALRYATGFPLDPKRERTPLTVERLPRALFIVACNTPSDASPLIRAIHQITRAKVLPPIPKGLLLLLKQKQVSFDDWLGAALEAENYPAATLLVVDSATLPQMQQMARANRCPLLRQAMTTASVVVYSWGDKPLGWAQRQVLKLGKSLAFFSEGDARMAVPGYRARLRDDAALIELTASPILFKQAAVTELFVDTADYSAVAELCAQAGFTSAKGFDSSELPPARDERAAKLAEMLNDAVDEVIRLNEAPASAAGGLVLIAKAQEQAERYADARDSYQLALEQAPTDLAVRLAMARYLELAGNLAEAERVLRGGLAHTPRDILSALRDFYRRHGDQRKTLVVAKLMARANHAGGPPALAVALIDAGKPKEALAALGKLGATNLAPSTHRRIQTVATLASSVSTLREKAEQTGAAEDFFALAEALRQTNDVVSAKTAYEAVNKADPTLLKAAIGEGAGPNFLVVGPPRTATTLLRRLLELHPKLGLTEGESAFLTNREPLPLQTFADMVSDVRQARPEAQLIGDKSPQHFALSDAHVELARTLLPQAKIIITTRDPVARAWSEVKLLRHARVVDASIAATLGPDAPPPPWLEEIFDNSRYLTHARKWVRHFGIDRVLLVQSEDLERDVVNGCKRIYRWLGIDPPPADEIATLQRTWSNRTFGYALKPALDALLKRHCGAEPYRVAELQAALTAEFAPQLAQATSAAS